MKSTRERKTERKVERSRETERETDIRKVSIHSLPPQSNPTSPPRERRIVSRSRRADIYRLPSAAVIIFSSRCDSQPAASVQ